MRISKNEGKKPKSTCLHMYMSLNKNVHKYLFQKINIILFFKKELLIVHI